MLSTMTNTDIRIITNHRFAGDARVFIAVAADARGDAAYDVADAAEGLANEVVAKIAAEVGVPHREVLEVLLGWGA